MTEEEIEAELRQQYVQPEVLIWKNMEQSSSLGNGHFSHVFLAQIKGNKTPLAVSVACKVLKDQTGTSFKKKDFVRREILNLSKLDHPNILGFYGYTKLDESDVLITEYMEHGNLESPEIRKYFDEKVVLKLALDISKGMECMHNIGILHRDLAPSNILVTGHVPNLTAKIGDLGLSRANLHDSNTSSIGQIKFMAPEVLIKFYKKNIMNTENIVGTFSTENWTTKSDVYSFGMVLWFLVKGSEPFSDLVYEGNVALLEKIVEGIAKVHIPEDCFLGNVIGQCLQKEPNMRPNFSTLSLHLSFMS